MLSFPKAVLATAQQSGMSHSQHKWQNRTKRRLELDGQATGCFRGWWHLHAATLCWMPCIFSNASCKRRPTHMQHAAVKSCSRTRSTATHVPKLRPAATHVLIFAMCPFMELWPWQL